MGSFVIPSPSIQTGMEVLGNKDWTGKPIVEPEATPLGKGVQAGEYAASKIYPLQLAEQALKPGGAEKAAGSLVGLDLKNRPPGAPPRVKAQQRRYARKREMKDPVERWLKGLGN